ncbi:hypothetical protein [Goodfellowiella coeruleoviolacea]|uniref:hypothetical protein n=1 Tax=Goodfellowiella coeruleoviolacea TaxID=334858 RepID=UPI0020A368A4|nr:hypothetical protein [Goodfellowiella coeruleoviolacea]
MVAARHEAITECSNNTFFIDGLRRLIEYRRSLQRDRAISAAASTSRSPTCCSIIDRMGRVPSTADPAFTEILRLVDAGRTWVRLSGVYLGTTDGPPSYADRAAVARAFVRAGTDGVGHRLNPVGGVSGVVQGPPVVPLGLLGPEGRELLRRTPARGERLDHRDLDRRSHAEPEPR